MTIIMIAVGLSMDAFAVSIVCGCLAQDRHFFWFVSGIDACAGLVCWGSCG